MNKIYEKLEFFRIIFDCFLQFTIGEKKFNIERGRFYGIKFQGN